MRPNNRFGHPGRAFAALLGLMAGICFSLVALNSAQAVPYSIGANFSDSTFGQSGFIPPDTMGAVGPNHVTVLINGRYVVYDRTGVQQTSSNLNQFWNSAGVTPSGSFAFDPRIIYDKHSSRWFATSVDNHSSGNNFLVAVSNSSDPTAGWTGFAVDSDADDSNWADFPMMGINNDVVTISANMFPISGSGASTSTGFLVLPKSDLTQAVPTVANGTLFEDISPSFTGFGAQPIFDYDNGSLPLPILSSYSKPSGRLKKSTIGGTATAPTLTTGGGLIGVTGRGTPPTIDQPGRKDNINAGDSRFSGNVIMQQIPGRTNSSIWGVQGINLSGRAAVEWYEIDAITNAVLQSGTISDPSLAFNYPSIAVNDFGDVVIGFSGGDPTTFMSTYAAVGSTTAGVTSFDPIVQTKAGSATYQRLDSSNRNRWGDYSATVVDPTDELSFWTFQLFANANDSWQVQVTQFNLVPEPSSLAALGLLALAGVLGRRRVL